MPSATPLAAIKPAAARKMVRAVIAHHLGSPPKRVHAQSGGLTNYVFMVTHAEGELVVRLSPDPAKIKDYIKEQWAIAKVRELKVPTPDILEVGNEVVPHPYMISRKVEGKESTFHPQRLEILHEMGRYGALINSIRTTGFGSTFDWSNNQLSKNDSWDDFLDRELALDHRLKTLEKCRILSKARAKKLAATLRGIGKLAKRPTLNHGDLRLKNVLVNEKGAVTAIIDWEDCLSTLSPFWELSVALHDLSVDEKQVLLDGYGLKPAKVDEIVPLLRALNIINYAPEIERLLEERDSAQLERYRLRLTGGLDLYRI
jgi:aminoglycoside phosphotransferase (APT) family kinase protein